MPKTRPKKLPGNPRENLMAILRTRFETHMSRHPDITWTHVRQRFETHPDRLEVLNAMEQSGGEPDVVMSGNNTEGITFYDCSPESPKGRVSVCYDREGWESRKEHRPKSNAIDMAKELGINLLTEQQYFMLQTFGDFDTKTSSWILTPPEIRELGGALYCDKRYGRVFVGHNGAQSYYAVRGFRGMVQI